ncbi:MAG TPA: lamin tail domain-containing protein, partial [Candidatus Paceibacterota bacterium]|nr:lamin tail domain-containing protein [Candidatus Paceibacterota bacterium]
LLDAVRFGLQIPNQSIGISPESGLWALTDPTPGTANRTAFLGDPSRIRINEWMAHPAGGNDWFELFNSGSDPVEVSGWWVTDDLARPLNHPLPPLSFLGAGADAWRQFEADNDPGQGAHHVGFRLDSQGESIGVFLPDGSPIDGLHFGPQIEGVSEGRWPDGQNRFLPFPGASSPGAANRIPAGPMRLEQAGWRSMGFHFLFEAAPGQAYAVQANEGLADDGWTDLIRIDAGTESRWIEVLDPAAPGSAARFYRLIALDPPMSGPELR